MWQYRKENKTRYTTFRDITHRISFAENHATIYEPLISSVFTVSSSSCVSPRIQEYHELRFAIYDSFTMLSPHKETRKYLGRPRKRRMGNLKCLAQPSIKEVLSSNLSYETRVYWKEFPRYSLFLSGKCRSHERFVSHSSWLVINHRVISSAIYFHVCSSHSVII